MNVYATLVSLLFPCLYLIAEFTAIDTAILALSDPTEVYEATGSLTDKGLNLEVGVVLGMSICTVLYTAVGGLPVSLGRVGTRRGGVVAGYVPSPSKAGKFGRILLNFRSFFESKCVVLELYVHRW